MDVLMREADASERLLQALAEQLKLPLLQIAQASELGRTSSKPNSVFPTIETAAESAMRFIDAYLLSNRLLHAQSPLPLEPVSLASILYDAAQSLDALAKQYNCDMEVQLNRTFAPVMAHSTALEMALTSVGQAIIEASSQQSEGKRPQIILAAHRSRGGVVAGVFAPIEGLSEAVFKSARQLSGSARQPLHNVLAGSAAGIFLAGAVLDAMSSRLGVARHHKLTGLAAKLLPSQQLQLV